MTDEANKADTDPIDAEERERSDRRDFLRSFGKWSTAAIAAILLIESSPQGTGSGWVNTCDSRVSRGDVVRQTAAERVREV